MIPQQYKQTNKQTKMRILWTIICQQIGNLEEMYKFLETYSPPKLNQKEIDNLNRLITRSEIESVIKNTQIPCKQKSRIRWLQWGILTNIQRIYTDPSQTSRRLKRKEHSPNILWSHHHEDTKTRQRYHQKRKLQANILD